MANTVVPIGNQVVKWFGNVNTPATPGVYKLIGNVSGNGLLQVDEYEPVDNSGTKNNSYFSSHPASERFLINGTHYFVVIERAAQSGTTPRFSNVVLYHSDQKIKWIGNGNTPVPGTYTISGNVSGDGEILIDEYAPGNTYIGQYKAPTTFTIAGDHYFVVIDRVYSGTATFSNVTLRKQ